MKINALSPVLFFHFEDSSKGFEFEDLSYFSNPNRLMPFTSNPSLMAAVGTIDLNTIRRLVTVSYSGDISSLQNGWALKCPHPHPISATLNSHVNRALSYLWFIKDNSVYSQNCYVHSPELNNCFRNVRSMMISNSAGEYSDTYFTLDELSQLDDLSKRIKSVSSFDPTNLEPGFPFSLDNPAVASAHNYQNYNNSINRLTRALRFLDLARSTSYLPQKISFYMSILECLFTTDSSEVTHKVSERASCFLGGIKSDKRDRFTYIKLAYKIRSTYLHGQVFKADLHSRNEWVVISLKIDSLIREVLRKIIFGDPAVFLEKKNDLLEKMFDEMLFE